MVSLPDAPGALTSGHSRFEALPVMLAEYVEDRKAIPVPSSVLDRQEIVRRSTR